MSTGQVIDQYTFGLIRESFAAFGFLYPWQRGLIMAAIHVVTLFVLRPSRSFGADGNPLPWVVYPGGSESTIIPWWLEAFNVGVFFALFI